MLENGQIALAGLPSFASENEDIDHFERLIINAPRRHVVKVQAYNESVEGWPETFPTLEMSTAPFLISG